MIKVTLKGDVVKEFENGITPMEIAKGLGAGLYKACCAAHVDGVLTDLRTPLDHDCKLELLTFEDKDGAWTFRHTASHILAQAVKRLYPNAKLAIGPAIDNGFYYDFDVEKPFSQEDLTRIEGEMKKIVKEGLPLERFELSPEEAKKMMEEKNEPYKVELIEKHAASGEPISFFKQGDFVDLCAGPHLPDTSRVKAFKLTSSTGAYWHGDSNLPMLCRVYGTAFPKASQLEEYLTALEEAKKRDHNIIGRQLKYFTTSDIIGQGLPLLMPKGAKLFQILNRYVQDKEENEYGYIMTKTPYMAKSDLYKLSGHWGHYKESMFVLGDEEKDKEVFALRPMTCPFQYQIYLSEKHSYRDLPLRYGETSTLFRNEASGEMHGLIRVRQFTISEGHLIVRPDQLEEEFKNCLKLTKEIMTDLGLIDELTYRFSKWDPNDRDKYEGTPEMWEEAQSTMRTILDHLEVDYTEAEGEAAFYGPKLDIQTKNVHGKEDTLITIQIDLMLAHQFEMTYTDKDNTQKYPYIIHRTSLGCYERTIAMLLEKYAGALPLWLSPVQAKILPISEKQLDRCREIQKELRAAGLRVELDDRNEKIGYKIREAQLEKIPYMLIVGEKEAASGMVSVRSRKEGDMGSIPADIFIKIAQREVETKAK
ncbi:threonine--tRNA ligase [Zongyangia hominis]|uniref:Threonine--tRNA ligase n=1 Tax=Zongyangia hominis TaxID=2763677 RepID=A0A926EEX9_9FIRM|nr:threonine--tRNA ligase [Zongyangia hominis]MBC8570831.1 threonine--tRNA ligase [Zongyangia hominis]